MTIPTSLIATLAATAILQPTAQAVPVPDEIVAENISAEDTRERFIGIVEHGLEGAVVGRWRVGRHGLICKLHTILESVDGLQHFVCYAGVIRNDHLIARGGTVYLGTIDKLIEIAAGWAVAARGASP